MDERFKTTRWSLVQAAVNDSRPDARQALADLCRLYWPPVYAYIRCRERDAETAREMTQGFFAILLEKDYLKDARQDRGRFRTFLLASVKNFLGKEWERARALKRGGGVATLSLDFDAEESRLRLEPVDRETPETIFERRWALSLLRQAIGRLENEMTRAGRQETFSALRPLLAGERADIPYAELAQELEMGESAVKVTVHRLRRRLGRRVREAVAETLSDPSLVDEEMRFLQATLRG